MLSGPVTTFVLALSIIQVACETYSEHLLVHSLTPTASSLTTAASFTGTVSPHGQTFPRAIAALFDTYPVQSFRLTLTRGRWKTEWRAPMLACRAHCGACLHLIRGACTQAPQSSACPQLQLRGYLAYRDWSTLLRDREQAGCCTAMHASEQRADTSDASHRAHCRSACRGNGVGGVPPPGATFQVEWAHGVPEARLPQLWTGVTNAVAGVFCSSLSTLAPGSMHYRPALRETWSAIAPPASAQDIVQDLESSASAAGRRRGVVVYGALSQEAVCTENLTGFTKLLPCRDRAGVGRLLDPAVVLSSPFHALELRGHMDANGARACAGGYLDSQRRVAAATVGAGTWDQPRGALHLSSRRQNTAGPLVFDGCGLH